MKYVKNQVYKTFYKSSTIPKGTMAEMGTIEKDACSYFGKHDKQSFHGHKILEKIVDKIKFNTVLDVGAGECLQSNYLKKYKKKVYTCDFKNIDGAHCNSNIKYNFLGNFLNIDFKEQKFDFVLASHILEHQHNPGLFIEKIKSVTATNGYVCIIVPIRKPFITGGHLSIWNPGLLMYNLVMAGIDCSESYIQQLDYDICVITKNKQFDLKNIKLTYDRGDIDLLAQYFPFSVKEPFNGDIMYYNTLFKEET
jgi:SAM-dependent methyltransferase